MHFFIFILLFCFFIFLFCLHYVGRDDFLLLRKNISLEKLFNLAFLIGVSSLFFARFFYVAFHFSKNFLNPLVFFIFPYFPGLSLAGGFAGGLLALFYLIKLKKMPMWKVFDLFMVSFLAALPLGFLGLFLLEPRQKLSIIHPIIALSYFVFFVICLTSIFPRVVSGKMKDKTLGTIIVLFICLLSLVENSVLQKKALIINGENILLVVLFFAFLSPYAKFIKKKKLFKRTKKLRRLSI